MTSSPTITASFSRNTEGSWSSSTKPCLPNSEPGWMMSKVWGHIPWQKVLSLGTGFCRSHLSSQWNTQRAPLWCLLDAYPLSIKMAKRPDHETAKHDNDQNLTISSSDRQSERVSVPRPETPPFRPLLISCRTVTSLGSFPHPASPLLSCSFTNSCGRCVFGE